MLFRLKIMPFKFCISIGLTFAMFLACGIGSNISAQANDQKRLGELNDSLVAYFKAGEFNKSAKAAEEALAISVRLFGPESLEAAVSHANLGVAQRERKKYKESIINFERAVTIRETFSGTRSDEMIATIEALAAVQLLAGIEDKAEANYKKAFELSEKVFGKGSREQLKGVLNLASFYSKAYKFAEADEMYLLGLEIAVQKFGPDSGEVELVDNTRGCLTMLARMPPTANKEYHEARKRILKDPVEIVDILDGKALHLPRPEYPAEARARNLGGIILVRVKIDEQGDVAEAKAVCGPDILRRSAEQSAKNARFSPTVKNGAPIKVSGMITYAFVPPGAR